MKTFTISCVIVFLGSVTAGCRSKEQQQSQPQETLNYRLLWQAETTGSMPIGGQGADAFSATFTLDADLIIQKQQTPNKETELRARFGAVRLFNLQAQGKSMVESETSLLLGHAIHAVYDADGKLRTVSFSIDSSEPFRAVMGELIKTVKFSGDLNNEDTAKREGSIEWTADGLLAHLDEEIESQDVGTMRETPDIVNRQRISVILNKRQTDLSWKEQFEPPMPADQVSALGDSELQLAKAFADGLTVTQMKSALLDVSRGLSLPQGMIRRMTGLLRSDNNAAKAVADLARNGKLKGVGLSLSADVLASAGTPVTQEALETLLAAALQSETSDEYGLLLQRFSMVRKPIASTIRFIESEHGRSLAKGDMIVARAALVTAGAVISRLYATGEAVLAAQVEDRLLGNASTIEKTEDIEARLAALGNLARSERTDDILHFISHESVSIRAQVAISLRDIAASEARTALLTLVKDSEVEVSSRALESFASHLMTDQEFDLLVESIERDEIKTNVYSNLQNLLASISGNIASRQRALKHMISRVPDGTLRQNLSMILADLSEQPVF